LDCVAGTSQEYENTANTHKATVAVKGADVYSLSAHAYQQS